MRKGNKAFTLVEIMIVVAIIGILIAIAVPGFIKARNTSRLTACQENQTKIDGAVQQLILEENYADLSDAASNATMDDLIGPNQYLKAMPVCPTNGTYSLLSIEGAFGESVACSLNTAGGTPATPPHDYPSGS